jgi:hypothetical protein
MVNYGQLRFLNTFRFPDDKDVLKNTFYLHKTPIVL